MGKDSRDQELGERQRIAALVQSGRLSQHWTKEEAARRAGVSSITWKRVEDGLTVRPDKLAAVLAVVDVAAVPTDVIDVSGLTAKQRQAVASVVSAMLEPVAGAVSNGPAVVDPDEQAILDSDLTNAGKREALTALRERRSGPGVTGSHRQEDQRHRA